MVWTREKERRARAHTTSPQHGSTRGKTKRRTTAKVHGYHPGGGIRRKTEWRRSTLRIEASGDDPLMDTQPGAGLLL